MSTKFASTGEHMPKSEVLFIQSRNQKAIFCEYKCALCKCDDNESNGYGILNSVDGMAADVGDTNGF